MVSRTGAGGLDPACGIDLYGENGIAVGDIDGDGVDEIYVCQPGGLPNRLYKNDGAGPAAATLLRPSGLDLLDDTAGALFADLRNSGSQDLVVVRTNEILSVLQRWQRSLRAGCRTHSASARRRRGRLRAWRRPISIATGAWICISASYVYYQSEAQYRYPVPYHDAQNGPPNFLFRNRLNESPGLL